MIFTFKSKGGNEMIKQYIGSDEHWEDSVNADYDQREADNKQQNMEVEKQIDQQCQEENGGYAGALLRTNEKFPDFPMDLICNTADKITRGQSKILFNTWEYDMDWLNELCENMGYAGDGLS